MTAEQDGVTRRTGWPRALADPVTWHYISLAVGAVFLLYVSRHQWFFFDEWGFLAERSVTIGSQGLFEPHNEHWSTTPLLLYGLVFRLFGMTSYLPYMSLVVVAHLAVVHVVWRIAVRSEVNPWMATAFCAAFLPFGPGADNLLWAFQVGFVGSVATGLAAILVQDRRRLSSRRLKAGWGMSVFALTFSGVSVPLVAASALVAWMRRGFRALLVAASVPAMVYLVWLLSVGAGGLGAVPVTEDTLRSSPAFLVNGLNAVLSLGTGTPLAGLVPIAVSAGALIVRRRRGGNPAHVAIAAGIGELLLLIMFALGRSGLGVEAAGALRYVYIGAALLLPLMLIGLSELARRRAVVVGISFLLALAWGINNARLLLLSADLEAERERSVREQLIAAATRFEPEGVLRQKPEPIFAPSLQLDELLTLFPRMDEDADIPRAALVRAALALQVSVTAMPEFETSEPLSAIGTEDADLGVVDDRCRMASPTGAHPRVLIPCGQPSSYALGSSATGDVAIRLTEGDLTPDYFVLFGLSSEKDSYLNLALDTTLLDQPAAILSITAPLQICALEGQGPSF